MTRATVLVIAVGVAAAACSHESPGEPTRHETRDPRVIVTLDADDAAALRAATAGLGPQLEPLARVGQIQLVALRESDLAALSDLVHAHIDRCGGFLVHDSLADAMDAARAFSGGFERRARLAGVEYGVDRAEVVGAVLPALDEARIVETIAALEAFGNRFHSLRGPEAADWLIAQWQELIGDRDHLSVHRIENRRTAMPSVELRFAGRAPERRVVIGAHLDTKNTVTTHADSPGADDDASGIAVLTEIARVLIAADYRPEASISFYAYAAEEVGLWGSAQLADEAADRGDTVLGVMQLDMVNVGESLARGIDGTILSDFADPELADFVRELIATYTPYTFTTSSCGYGCSDHASWARNGFPAVMPFESDFSDFDRSRIHSPDDTLERSEGGAAQARKFAEIGAAFVIELAKGQLGALPPGAPDAGPPGADAGANAPEDAGPPGPDAAPTRLPDAAPASEDPAPGADAGPGAGANGDQTGGCRAAPPGQSAASLALLGVALLLARRRRSRP